MFSRMFLYTASVLAAGSSESTHGITQNELLQLFDLRNMLSSLLRYSAALYIEQACTRLKSKQGLALGQFLADGIASVAL